MASTKKTNKGTPANAQAAPEAVPTAATITETVTPAEQEFLDIIRRGKSIMDEEKAERNARIDTAAESLKALESDEDLDKALDVIGRITGTAN